MQNHNYSLNVISQITQDISQQHHVFSDRVEVLEGAVDVAGALVKIQGIVQNQFVTDQITGEMMAHKSTKKNSPLTVKFISVSFVYFAKLFLQIGRQVNGRVEVFPNKSVVLNISEKGEIKSWSGMKGSYLMKFC